MARLPEQWTTTSPPNEVIRAGRVFLYYAECIYLAKVARRQAIGSMV
jgi:hypothetical protein